MKKIMQLKIILFILVLSATAFSQQTFKFGMNDVSILFPLPAQNNFGQLWGTDFQTQNGILLPENYFLRLPVLAFKPNAEIKENIKVIGLRIDPCFNEQVGPVKCEKQLRLIWQPLSIEQNTVTTLDAAIHTFYSLTDIEFSEIIDSLKKLNSNYPNRLTAQTFLQLNPILKTESLTGNYFTSLTQLIEKYAGENKLTRMTFMAIAGGENVWIFGGFNIQNNQVFPIQIPRINARIQEFRNSAGPMPFWFQGGMFPEPKQTPNLNILIKDSRKLAPANEAEIIEATRAAFQFENPKLNNPGTVDCVSCHVAQVAKTWAMKQYPWLDLSTQLSADIYQNANNDIRNASPMQIHTDIMRSFGYFMNRPFVSQRTINETSEVVNQLNSYAQSMEPK